MENVQRPMITTISMAPLSKAHATESGKDDGQRCPMTCYAIKNFLYVHESQRFGHDNLYNRHEDLTSQVYSGHDNKIVLHGFSPAGAKIFSIDASGHCIVWGSPDSPCSGTILGVTDFGSAPSFARFVDHEILLIVTSRGLTLWNSASSQVSQLLNNPTRLPFEDNFAMLHYIPPAYVFGSPDDTELLQLPPHVKVHRLLEQLREKKFPTVTFMSFDGITLLDVAERRLKVYRRQHIPPQNEMDCEQPPKLIFDRDPAHSCAVLPQVSSSDRVGNRDIENWKWFFGSKMAYAVDRQESMVKAFDVLRGQQVPLFLAIPNLSRSAENPCVFNRVDDVAACGEGEDRVVVAESDGTIHVLSLLRGPLLYPTPPITTQ
jgi:hypothetical protein